MMLLHQVLERHGFIRSTVSISQSIIFVCEDFFLYIRVYCLFFYSSPLQRVFSHFDKAISVGTDGLQIFEDWNRHGANHGGTPHIEIAISDTRGNRIILPHAT